MKDVRQRRADIDRLFWAAFEDVKDGHLSQLVGYSFMLELCREARQLPVERPLDGTATEEELMPDTSPDPGDSADEARRRARLETVDMLDDLQVRLDDDLRAGALENLGAHRLKLDMIRLRFELIGGGHPRPFL